MLLSSCLFYEFLLLMYINCLGFFFFFFFAFDKSHFLKVDAKKYHDVL